LEAPPLFAHRLGKTYGPDNSRAALRRSLSQPIEGLETDCCLTSDGELYLLHDANLGSGTDLHGWAHEHSAAEIQACHLLDAGSRQSDQHPMPLLELLDSVPADVRLQLEVKAVGRPELARRTAQAVCNLLRDHPARSQAEVISFWSTACETAAALGFPARLVTFAEYAPETLASWANENGVRGVSIEHFLLHEGLVELFRSHGISVTSGTVNRPELLERLVPLDVDGVTTDRPHEVRAELLARRPG
jgi:glycerophosphoryl diester phosphodiesterase